jgi:hypothetical protein
VHFNTQQTNIALTSSHTHVKRATWDDAFHHFFMDVVLIPRATLLMLYHRRTAVFQMCASDQKDDAYCRLHVYEE